MWGRCGRYRINLLPTVWAFLNIRMITFGVVAVIPVTGWILLGSRRGSLDVDRRCCRYGDDSWRIIIGVLIRIAVVRIRIKRCAEVKTKTGITIMASMTIAPAAAIMASSIVSTPATAYMPYSATTMRPCRVAGYRPDQDDNQTDYCDLFHRRLHPALAGFFKI